MKPTQTIQSQRNCRGMTLVEVLVSAVIIGIGLMGVAALQMTALQGSTNAQSRSRTADLVSSLADRMRANQSDVNSYISAVPAGNCAATVPAAICAMQPNAADLTGVSQCTPGQMAAYDLWEIRCNAETDLSGGQVAVSCVDSDITDADPCSSMSSFRISISWQVQDTEAGFETQEVITTIVPGIPPSGAP
ncbi:MAG: type IV pilus modification protein PilV [Candidatus Thiodiazotropha sp. (ex Dulcina madagascariensis)]|nr:type IV pilus modification protein PilV [Candidatus Thiodiazotropha sp. (ex Dulcina madagascariensis)]MCU7926031.1 type IV pilus modification protein PilV [Candidatus Thiodiazotropha sp. (ex Dulcina madagascariensis)]